MMQRLVLFQVSGRRFGLDMALAKSIEATNVPQAKGADWRNRGTLVVDGEKVPIYDLAAIMGDTTFTHDARNRKVILVKVQGRYLALLVDRMDRPVEVDNDLVEPLPPIFRGPPRDCFPKVLRREDELILILSPEGLGRIAKHREGV